MELETRLQEMEKRKIDTEAEHHERLERAEEQCHKAEDLREQAEKEAMTCRQAEKEHLFKFQLYSLFRSLIVLVFTNIQRYQGV